MKEGVIEPRNPDHLDTVLLQHACGEQAQLLDITQDRHQRYCDRHNIFYWQSREHVAQGRPVLWNKVSLILAAYKAGFKRAIWLDADTMIADMEMHLRRAINDRMQWDNEVTAPQLAMTFWDRRDIPSHPHFNAGMIAMRMTPVTSVFWRRVWDTYPVPDKTQDQAAINSVLSLDRSVPVAILRDEWNSVPGYHKHGRPIIYAWHGMTTAQKLEYMPETVRRLEAVGR